MERVSASYSAMIRMRLVDEPGAVGRVATAISEAGASLGSIDLVRVEKGHKVRDVAILAEDEDHVESVAAAEATGVARRRPSVASA